MYHSAGDDARAPGHKHHYDSDGIYKQLYRFAPLALLRFSVRHGREILFLVEGLKAALEVVGQRRRIIERTRMQPHAVCAPLPRALDRFGQQLLAYPAS